MRERYQGGSLAGFIIIGVLLTLLLVGGLYGLNRYNAEQSKEVATDNNGASEEKPSSNSDKESSKDPEPKTDKPTESKDEKQASGSDKSSDSKSSTDKQLPSTGPADTAAAILAVIALSFAGVHYLQSRAHRGR